MDAGGDQTGFSSSPPVSNTNAASSGSESGPAANGIHDHDDNNNSTGSAGSHGRREHNKPRQLLSPAPPHHQDLGIAGRSVLLVKEEPRDDPDRTSAEGATGTPLSPGTDEGWKTAYFQPPLVAVIEDPGGLYDTYKLPPLAKFGSGLVRRLPAALWSVPVVAGDDGNSAETNETAHPQPALERSVIIEAPGIGSVKTEQVTAEEEDGTSPVGLLGGPQAAPVERQTSPARGDSNEMSLEHSGSYETGNNTEFEGPPYAAEEPQYSVLTNVVVTAPPQYGTNGANVYALTTADYYREYYNTVGVVAPQAVTESQPPQHQLAVAQAVRQQLAAAAAAFPEENVAYVERLIRQQQQQQTAATNYKITAATPHLNVDLPSPDSGIGEAGGAAILTPRDALHQIFEYAEIAQAQPLLQPQAVHGDDEAPVTSVSSSPTPSSASTATATATSHRKSSSSSWSQEFGRNSDADKVHIPKVFSELGFRYHLESPISTSQRREDDRMTYINKGQYYGITLEYIPDPDRPLRSCTVKSTVILLFREEKSAEEELKAWKFWHGRQHSLKQRILDADTKNSTGIIGQIEEVTHNAIAFYWNPMEGPAKISVSVHCLSTDFSNQKGVKGLPLHLQIDTTDDLRENSPPVHRGYCQIKVFCDKGAERKTRDEERRAAKRKLTATGNSRKKMEDMYHLPCERSEFYSMSDLTKPPVLFTPHDDAEKNGPELTFYTIAAPQSEEPAPLTEDVKIPLEVPVTPVKKLKLSPSDRELTNVSYWDHSVLLYAKRADEDVFYPLHLVPPSLTGLAKALEAKYSINSSLIRNLYKRCKKGVTVVMDDDMVRHYCNEDTFIVDIQQAPDNKFDITLVEL